MKKLNVVLVNSPDISKVYGIGSYLNYLKNELAKREDINIIYVEVNSGTTGKVSINHAKFTSIQITFKHTHTKSDLPSTYSSLIFNTIVLNTNIKDGIFHINVPTELELCKIARERKFKVILTQHLALNDENALRVRFKHTIQSLYSQIDGCIFLSEETRENAIRDLHFSKEKSIVIYNGIKWKRKKSSSKEIRTRMGFLQDDFIAVFVGRLEKSKGLNELIEAFKRFSAGDSNKKLIIIGAGDFKEILKMTKDNIGNFFFTGFLNKEEISDFYQIADIGIHPSHSEQSSLAVIEMIHNNIPLIVSDISGFSVFQNNEVIKTSINVINESISIDIESLYKNILLLYENKNLRKALTKAARHYKENQMNIKYTATQTANFYKKILIGKPASQHQQVN